MPGQDESYMRMAIELAKRGEGRVEPNPMVGCVIVRDGEVIGKGFHEQFGGPHAEVNGISSAAPTSVSGATAYVTLEPCSHVGKTGPCSQALIDAKIARVIVACEDPNPQVSGNGIEQLRKHGINVEVGVLAAESKSLIAPFCKHITSQLPFVIGKWAMTLDGKIATSTGDSKWISNKQSREIVHQLRGRMDGIMVGIGTVLADDPMLNARPENVTDIKRIATRIVVDSNARTPLGSKLVQSAKEFPTLIAVGPNADESRCESLKKNGCQILKLSENDSNLRLNQLMAFLGSKGGPESGPITNLLVEGGGQLMGSLNDQKLIDEVHCFIGPSILGGSDSKSPMAGIGHWLMSDSTSLTIQNVSQIGSDIYIVGRTNR